MAAPLRPVTAQDLYDEMKEAMAYLGVRWGDKHLINVKIEDNKLVLFKYSKSIAIDLNMGKEPQ